MMLLLFGGSILLNQSPATAETHEPTGTPQSYATDINDPRESNSMRARGIFPTPVRFKSRTDQPHFSSSGGARAVSVHGWWEKVSGPAQTATVRIELWARPSNEPGFRKVNEQTLSGLQAGGGRGQRATARHVCKGDAKTIFRGDVDVDIEGHPDLPGVVRGREVTLPCGI